MVRDLKKILETLEVHEATQERIKTIQLAENASMQDTLKALSVLTESVQGIAVGSAGSIDCLNDKINIIKDFVIKQAEEATEMRLRILQLEEKLNAKD